jgi:nucleoid DNA-binding protein
MVSALILESGHDVIISGFGNFGVKKKKKRRGRNPATEENMILKKRRVVAFRCSGKYRKNLTEEGLRPRKGFQNDEKNAFPECSSVRKY